jgi:hypothetical protein
MMKRFMRFSLAAALAGAIGVGVMSSSALATGGVSVDSDRTCDDVHRQDNTLDTSSTGYVWLNLPKQNPNSPYTYSLYNDNAGAVVTDAPLIFTQCDSTSWFVASFTVPGTEGTYTIKVTDADGKSVGGDAFQAVIPIS